MLYVEGLYRDWPDRDSLIGSPRAAGAARPHRRDDPKESLLDAVDSGVRTAAMTDGRIEHAVLLEVFTDKGVGTMVRRDDYV